MPTRLRGQAFGIAAYWTLSLGQVGTGFRGTLREALNWMERNPGQATLYAAIVAVFIWSVWRFGKN